MAGIRLEWAQFGDFESFDVIRSNSTMTSTDDEDLPSPIATGLTTMYYVDTAVVEGATYYYKVKVWREGIAALSDEISIFAAEDQYLLNVSLLLKFNGANNSTTFIDDSLNAKTVVAHGNAKISTAQSISGISSGYFDGVNSYLTIPLSPDFNFGLGDFTIEMWLYIPTNNTSDRYIIGNTNYGWNSGAFYIHVYNGYLGFNQYGYEITKAGSSYPLNQWVHVAVVRESGTITVFQNGVKGSSTNNIHTQMSLNLAKDDNVYMWMVPQSLNLDGFIDNLRVTKGVARYTSNFTPPISF
jgi:hypothetical protein